MQIYTFTYFYNVSLSKVTHPPERFFNKELLINFLERLECQKYLILVSYKKRALSFILKRKNS